MEGDESLFYITQEIMHQIALLPVLILLVTVRRHPQPLRSWLIAGAIGISWLADSTNFLLLEHDILAMVMRLLLPLQVAVVLWVAIGKSPLTLPLLGGLSIMAVASAVQGGAFDLVVPLVGGFVIMLYARNFDAGYMRAGLVVHFGLGALTWTTFTLTATEPSRTAFVTWAAFQLTRLTGILLITAALIQKSRQPRLELV